MYESETENIQNTFNIKYWSEFQTSNIKKSSDIANYETPSNAKLISKFFIVNCLERAHLIKLLKD